jgi:hypothetical protein
LTSASKADVRSIITEGAALMLGSSDEDALMIATSFPNFHALMEGIGAKFE